MSEKEDLSLVITQVAEKLLLALAHIREAYATAQGAAEKYESDEISDLAGDIGECERDLVFLLNTIGGPSDD